MEKFCFLFSLLLLFAVIMTITSFNPIHSVFWLVVVFIQSACFMLTLGFEFLGFMLIIIYVGAITILFLFVIMMLDIIQISKISRVYHIFPILILIISQFLFSIEYSWIKLPWTNNWEFNFTNQIHSLGGIIYSDYALLFILISILLLIAMVGAIVLTLEIGHITKRQYLTIQHQRNNSWI